MNAVFTHLDWHPTRESIESCFNRHAPGVPAGTYPHLDVTLSDIKAAFRTRPASWRNQVLGSLVAAAQNGDALAHLTVIYLLLPKAITLVTSARSLRLYSLPDALAIYIGALWERILVHPLSRAGSISGNLTLDAMGTLDSSTKRGNRDHLQETSYDALPEYQEQAIEAGLTEAGHRTTNQAETSERDLAAVLAWSLDAGILTRDDVILLTRYYLAGNPTQARDDLAAELGLNLEACRKRASRARAKLVDAVRSEITESGWIH